MENNSVANKATSSTEEIERKFLLKNDNWRPLVSKTEDLKQVYVCQDRNHWLTRLRIINDEEAELTIKGPKKGIKGKEYNVPMDLEEAKDLWEAAEGVRIQKVRHIIENKDGTKWEIDEFKGEGLNGVFLAEIELKNTEQNVELPEWIGLEVSGLNLYSNDYMARATFNYEDEGVCPPTLNSERTLSGILQIMGIDVDVKLFSRAMFENVLQRERDFGSNFKDADILSDEKFIAILKENQISGSGFTLRKLRTIESLLNDKGLPEDYHKVFLEYAESLSQVEPKQKSSFKP